jgi:hypothetical protein
MSVPTTTTHDTPLDESLTEAEYERFYTAAQVQEQAAMETLLQKGLYGEKLPKPLRGQKAANAFQHAFELIGGVPRLALWADKNPSAFFALYSKLIPSTVQAQVNSTITINAPWMDPNRLKYMDAIDVTPPALSEPKSGN